MSKQREQKYVRRFGRRLSLVLELAYIVLAYIRRLPGGSALPHGQPVMCVPDQVSSSGAEAADGDIESQMRFRVLFGDPWTFRCDIVLSAVTGEGTLPECVVAAWRDEDGKERYRTWKTHGWCEEAFLDFLTRRLALHSGVGPDGSSDACDATTRAFADDFPLHFFGTPIPDGLILLVERDTKSGLTTGLLTDGACIPVAGRSQADPDGSQYESIKVRLEGATFWCLVRNDPGQAGSVVLCDGAFVEPMAGQAAIDAQKILDGERAVELLGAMTSTAPHRRMTLRDALVALLAV